MSHPSTRVWRQLRDTAPQPRSCDAALRMELAAMAADATSPLTTMQRATIIALASRTTRLTGTEIAEFKAPLLRWLTATMPRCRAIVARQFAETENGE